MSSHNVVAGGAPEARSGVLVAYLQLVRLPNLFTALADSLMGYWMIQPGSRWSSTLGLVLLGTGCLYSAGMVLNDLCDVQQDRQQRPSRPLPSGRVPIHHARWLAALLFAGGWLSVLGVVLFGESGVLRWGPVSLASALILLIVLYDAWLKTTPLGPWIMGSCRGVNILMAMLTGLVTDRATAEVIGWVHVAVAAVVTTYVAGITYFARNEAQTGPRSGLWVGLVFMAFGWGGLAAMPMLGLGRPEAFTLWRLLFWYALLLAGVLALVGRAARALRTLCATHVQATVRLAIWELIWWDAALLLLDPRNAKGAVIVVCFVLPMRWLGRWIYST